MPVRTRPEKQGKMFTCYFIPLTLFCQEKKARNRLIVRLYENCIFFSAKYRASRGRLPNLHGGSVPASSARIRCFVRMKQISCYFASEKCPNMLFTNLLCTFNKSIFIFLANTPCWLWDTSLLKSNYDKRVFQGVWKCFITMLKMFIS